MKTEVKTVGFGGGFTNAQTTPTKCGTAAMVPIRRREVARMAQNKDARPVLQHRTGASNCRQQMTDDSLAHLPRWQRWGLYAFAATCMTGIVPIALAEALIYATNLFSAWLESIIGAGGMSALFIGSCLAAVIVCMVYLFKLVFK